MNIGDVLREGMDEEIEKLSIILENNKFRKFRKRLKRAEKLREKINCKKALLKFSKNDF